MEIRPLDPRWLAAQAPALILTASVAVLGSALASQFIGGLRPCPLCIYQRWPYVATILLTIAALTLFRGVGARRALLALCGTAFLVGGGIAFYHVGVEQHWFQGLQGCTAPEITKATTAEELARQLLATPVVRCDVVQFSVFGVSMAGYNFLASLVLAGFSLWAAMVQRKADAA